MPWPWGSDGLAATTVFLSSAPPRAALKPYHSTTTTPVPPQSTLTASHFVLRSSARPVTSRNLESPARDMADGAGSASGLVEKLAELSTGGAGQNPPPAGEGGEELQLSKK
jgi:lysyl-tRNA synthetase, class II